MKLRLLIPLALTAGFAMHLSAIAGTPPVTQPSLPAAEQTTDVVTVATAKEDAAALKKKKKLAAEAKAKKVEAAKAEKEKKSCTVIR